MKKHLTAQHGVTLIELIIGMTLAIILLSGMLSLFSTQLTSWAIEKNRTGLQQTARIAVDKMMREIRYAQDMSLNNTHSLKITKSSGEINTFQLGGELHVNTLYLIIDKTHAIPPGGSSTNPITENIVTNLLFTPYPSSTNFQAVGITLEVTDGKTGQKQTIHTASFPLNRH